MRTGPVLVVCVRDEAERELAAQCGAGAVVLSAGTSDRRRIVSLAGGRAADLEAILVQAEPAEAAEAADVGTSRIAVAIDPATAMSDLQARGFAGVLFDNVRDLLDRREWPLLTGAVEDCRRHALLCGFAGGLEAPDIPRLLALGPDFLVIGRAVRVGRAAEGAIDPTAVRMAADLFASAVSPDEPATAAVRPHAEPAHRPWPLDRIFVRDLVLPVFIGAYASEVGRQQRVRFTVEAEVATRSGTAEDMRDVVSYDLLADAVHQVAGSAHVELAEAMAESIAVRVLHHPRIVRVRVLVEKLDLGPGAMGVEIWRGRPISPGAAGGGSDPSKVGLI